MADRLTIGWGRKVKWPGDQPMAMTIGCALEAFERFSQYRLERSSANRDEFSLSYADYGVRVGVWRLLEIFEDEDVHASFSLSGLLAEQHPTLIKTIVDAGHDVVGHGWANDLLIPDLGPDGERELISKTLGAIEAAGGRRPTGWSSPGNLGSEHTRDILLDEGVTWSGDDASDDVPFVEQVGQRRMAVLPKVNVDANDLIHWIGPKHTPKVFSDNFTAAFDTMHAEGLRGAPRWADMVLHCHMAGRPSFAPTIRHCIAHVKKHPDVWWTTKSELASWTLAQDYRR